jgi:hypothetical protein
MIIRSIVIMDDVDGALKIMKEAICSCWQARLGYDRTMRTARFSPHGRLGCPPSCLYRRQIGNAAQFDSSSVTAMGHGIHACGARAMHEP